MKFISYKLNSEFKFGIIDNNLITDLTDKISGAHTLKDLIFQKGISEAKKFASANPGNLSVDEVEYLRGDARKAFKVLKFKPKYSFKNLVKKGREFLFKNK